MEVNSFDCPTGSCLVDYAARIRKRRDNPMSYWKDFANEWLHHAEGSQVVENGKVVDPFLLFFCYYMVFDKICQSHPNVESVWSRYQEMMKNWYALNRKWKPLPRTELAIANLLFFTLPAIQFKMSDFVHKELEKPLKCGEKEPYDSVDLRIRRAVAGETHVTDNLWDDIAIFEKIGKVRNHLFHGDKWPESYRDRELVEESVPILKTLLNKLVEMDSLPMPTD